jgi:hypothetical protein
MRYRDFKALGDSENRPYLHIVDGGVSDNLGLRGMLEAFEQLEASPVFQSEMRFSELRHIVVIAVNSRSAPATDWDRKPTPPGIVSQLIQSSSVPIDHFSFESVELLRDIAARWADRRALEIARRVDAGQSRAEAEVSVPRITFDAIDVSFDAIEDPAERREFMESRRPSSCPRKPLTGCASWAAGCCATRAPIRSCSSASRSSRSTTLRRPRSPSRAEDRCRDQLAWPILPRSAAHRATSDGPHAGPRFAPK